MASSIDPHVFGAVTVDKLSVEQEVTATDASIGSGRFGRRYRIFSELALTRHVDLPRYSMKPCALPHLTITDLEPDCCTVRYDPSPWIGEGWIAGINLEGSRFIWGRFLNVNATVCTSFFHPDQAGELPELKSGTRHPFIDGYWGERAALVLKEGSRWQRIRFEPTDLLRFPADGGGWMATRSSHETPRSGDVVPGGWDHEHCNICWTKIGCGGEAGGYFDPPDAWVCEECFTRFVVPKSLAFITM